MTGALSHLRVLDLSRVLAGPWATQILGDLGAEIIKIERPGHGDDTRAWGPPWLQAEDGGNSSQSAYFLSANRNKKSVTIDFTKGPGQDLVRDLAMRSDVLVENFKLGGLAAYGLDYTALRAINPRLIYCSITGFGHTGPYATRAGYDFLVQGMSGLMSITGRGEGEPGNGPIKAGVAVTDILTGLYASSAILAALAQREISGRGQHIDLALLDVQIACLANQASNYLTTGQAPVRLGNAHPSIVPYEDFPTADGYMIIAVGNDRQFLKLCDVLGLSELASDPRFITNTARVEHRKPLIASLRQKTVQRDTAAWIPLCEAAGVPCGPINTIAEAFSDPHVQARGMQIKMAHSLSGTVPLTANPIRLSETPVQYHLAPPLLGEHSHSVLSSVLGLTPEAIQSLVDAKVI